MNRSAKPKQHEIDGDQSRSDLVGEELGGGEPRLFERARVSRDEGRGERPFGEDGAEMVGEAERDEKGVGHGPRAKDCRHDHVADKAGEARDEREPADGGNAPDHAWLRAVNCPSPFAAKAYPKFSPLTMRPLLQPPLVGRSDEAEGCVGVGAAPQVAERTRVERTITPPAPLRRSTLPFRGGTTDQ